MASLITSLCLGGSLLAAGASHASADAPKGERSSAPIAIAHRGASAYAPEHTFHAYDLALEMGATYIEQDLQMTADGELVVFHDPVLTWTADGPAENCKGAIITKTVAQLKTCDVGSWFNEWDPDHADPDYVGARIPTLEEVFERYGRSANYYIETKNPEAAPGMEEKLLELLREYKLRGPAIKRRAVLIQSFSPTSLLKIHALDPELPLIQLGITGGDPAYYESVSRYAVGVGFSHKYSDKSSVESAHAACLEVHPYTVNEKKEMIRMLRWGADGMFSDRPDLLLRMIDLHASDDVRWKKACDAAESSAAS